MPPLTGEASRFAPRATGFCIDERISHPGRSRSAKSGLPCQGSGPAASLTPRSGLCEDRCSQPCLKLPRMRGSRLRLFPFRSLIALRWIEKRGSVSMPRPSSDEKYGLQTLIRSTNMLPSFCSRVKLQVGIRVLRCQILQLATPLCFSGSHHTLFLRRMQDHL
jgi:hypothetical protein